EMRQRGQHGSVVTLLCDSGERYTGSYFDDGWVAAQGMDPEPWLAALAEALPNP
ncbi:MAG: PLP-dependent cysteine synthase family protein, partial [Actinomycetia bacterium]|nr:PLP-dependent cysteine synthase family protein [Actinomycetes bacterium]